MVDESKSVRSARVSVRPSPSDSAAVVALLNVIVLVVVSIAVTVVLAAIPVPETASPTTIPVTDASSTSVSPEATSGDTWSSDASAIDAVVAWLSVTVFVPLLIADTVVPVASPSPLIVSPVEIPSTDANTIVVEPLATAGEIVRVASSLTVDATAALKVIVLLDIELMVVPAAIPVPVIKSPTDTELASSKTISDPDVTSPSTVTSNDVSTTTSKVVSTDTSGATY